MTSTKTSNKTSRFIAGSCAGIVTAGFLQPFDVLRTQQQGRFNSKQFLSEPRLLSTTRAIVNRHGISGLWRGTTPSLIRVGLGAGTYFVTLSYLMEKSTGNKNNSALQSNSNTHAFLSGAIARTFAGAALCPLTVVKARMEWEAGERSSPKYRSMNRVFYAIIKQDGFKGLYRGLVATMIRDAPFSGCYVMLYSFLKERCTEHIDPSKTSSIALVNFSTGLASGLLATGLTHPLDTIKTRVQLPIDENRKITLSRAIQRLYQEEGLRGFYRGYLPRMLKRAGSTAVTWTIFEYITALLGDD